MIFSHVLVHVVAELNILGKYNLLCVYLVVQKFITKAKKYFRNEMASFVHVVCECLNGLITAFLEATTPR